MDFKSRFSFWRVYFTITLAVMFFFGSGYMLMYENRPKTGTSKAGLIVLGAICIFIGIYFLYFQIKQLPVIKIDNTGIKIRSPFQNKQFIWSDIESVKYSGKEPFQFGTSFTAEAMVIQLKDQNPVKVFYEYYANGHNIQQWIRSFHEHHCAPVFIREKSITSKELTGTRFTDYKGIPLLSLYGVLLWGFMLFILVLTLKYGFTILIYMGIIYLMVYAIFGYFCFYIKLSDNHLVVKNYFIPFLGKKYRLSEIQEIVIETDSKWPNCLRVITNSFRYKLFPCAPIWDKEWKVFIGIMEERAITVRNEVHFSWQTKKDE